LGNGVIYLQKKEMKEKTIEIIAPEGYEVDKERSSFEKIVFRVLPEKLPRTWGELERIGGCFVDSSSNVRAILNDGLLCTDSETVRNTWPTREEAEASIALAQLCQLRDRYNGGWKPSTEDRGYWIYIKMFEGKYACYLLTFKTRGLRDEFANNFSDLIEKAKPLLG